MMGLAMAEHEQEKATPDSAIANNSVGFGLMLAAGWDRSVDYSLFEVAHHNIGIISKDPLLIGTQVTIDYRDSQLIPLIVHQIIPNRNLPPGYHRFRLISTNPDINFEQILPESSHRKVSFSNRHQYNVRFARFETEIQTRIEARTFGSEETYVMKTLNVSKSGFLLSSPPGFRVPFHGTTLLELTAHLDSNLTIRCLGKVMRCDVDVEHKVKRYGVAIVDIHSDDRASYFSYIENIERQQNRLVRRVLNLMSPKWESFD